MVIGFVVGLFTSQVFGMISRAISNRWIRYEASIGDLVLASGDYDDPFPASTIEVYLHPPKWKSILAPPVAEVFYAEMRVREQRHTFRIKWVLGDVEEYLLNVTTSTRVAVHALTSGQDGVCLGGSIQGALAPGSYTLQVSVKRVVDKSLAGHREFRLEINKQGVRTTIKVT